MLSSYETAPGATGLGKTPKAKWVWLVAVAAATTSNALPALAADASAVVSESAQNSSAGQDQATPPVPAAADSKQIASNILVGSVMAVRDTAPLKPKTSVDTGGKTGPSDSSMGTMGEAQDPLPSAPPRESAETNTKSMSADNAAQLNTAARTELYGPPDPKVQRGKLADIAWPDAPAGVPSALETAVVIVTKNYPSAKAARSALRAANQDVKAAKWQRFPSVSGNLSYLKNDTYGGPEPQLDVEQPLWSGGRIGADIRRAKAAEDQSSADYITNVQQLALTVAQTYFSIDQLTRRERLLSDSMYEHLSMVETMQHRVDQEVSPLADLELAKSRAAQIEQQYTSARSQRQTQLRVLAELVADPSFDLGPVPAYDPALTLDNPAGLEDQAVAFDPQLRSLKAQVDEARAQYDAAKASILPQVNAQYTYDQVYKSRFGVVLRAQTTGGLSQISQVNSARLRIDTALETGREAEQRLRRDIASEIIEFQSEKDVASISTRASETAAQVSDSYKRQFIAGRRSWLDVMNALRETVDAQIAQSDAEVGAQANYVTLMIRSGRWRPNFDTPGQSETQEKISQATTTGQM